MRSIQYGTWAFSYIKPVTQNTHFSEASNIANYVANKFSQAVENKATMNVGI